MFKQVKEEITRLKNQELYLSEGAKTFQIANSTRNDKLTLTKIVIKNIAKVKFSTK